MFSASGCLIAHKAVYGVQQGAWSWWACNVAEGRGNSESHVDERKVQVKGGKTAQIWLL